jgi:nitroreductase
VALSERAVYLRRYARPDKASSTSATPAAPAGSAKPADSADSADSAIDEQWPVPYWDLDTAMACMIALLAATDAGLGSCYFGIPASGLAPLRATFDIPDGLSPIGMVGLGYEADYLSGRRRRARRPPAETTSWGRYGTPAQTAS